MRKALRDLAEDQRQVFRASTYEHAGEDCVRLYRRGVHRRPREADDRLDERGVRALEARDDVREREEPQAQLRRRGGAPGELVHELAELRAGALRACVRFS